MYRKFTFILGCIYCNKWQEAELFEFVPHQKSKTIQLKEKMENKNVELLSSSIDRSSPVPNASENISLINNQSTTIDYSDIHEDISQNSDDNQESIEQEDHSMDADSYVPENYQQETSELSKVSNIEKKKRVKRKLGFLQMRIDSTIYFDNMGYSYQIQNEKNDKK